MSLLGGYAATANSRPLVTAITNINQINHGSSLSAESWEFLFFTALARLFHGLFWLARLGPNRPWQTGIPLVIRPQTTTRDEFYIF